MHKSSLNFMKGLLLSIIFLSVLSATIAQPPEDECPSSWHLVETPPGPGQWEWVCRLETRESLSSGRQV
ncbi:hypothetical protein E1B28_011819 [Marasmius oreades]|uniref:Uncharacterized protein n=1 Tax=Marasmius oreades TaxID=181124 RepID=A0A9P7RVI3_9AGAR|nr:uncharacterized protein E1B28_011819 [Marasmius oreades]KAG7090218.1 hypothetical protein E1B28_011819 [Marasmius oreades]